ncbi:MAG: DNRLRE domain-containing protein [Microcystis sp.]|jgi:hypothetical protein|uniref:DNRLRE domain-containing protein n=1 Tax=Microcystis sp. TaxID=1127 RepID=UPI0022C8444D|nr:DNRLRE domain-containing protein [Microcystis sp. LE17-20D]MCZ8068106.1 DNRLRE domain-containing protein [Microcystis sp. LE17-20D]MCZ8160060.1 DNRLRE domain-containing protein [Microcystis sp. LE19-196.1B]MCZ8274171.1 DNRLRE domain-containing protein [Microcystis sp. LE19-4.1E]
MTLSKMINYLSLHEYRLSELLTVSSLTLTTALATVPVSAAVITFQPGPEGKDTYVDSRPYSNVPGIIPPYNTVNWGSEPRMLLGEADTGAGYTDTLIQFDLSTLPSVGVNKVSLILTTLSDSAPSFVEPFLASAHRITSASDENTVTWDSRPSFAPTPVASTTVDDIAARSFEWDITSLYLDWKNGVVPNLGIYLTGETIAGEGVAFVSSDNTATPALRPILRVETIDVASVPEPTSTLAFFILGSLGTASTLTRKLSQGKKSKQDN